MAARSCNRSIKEIYGTDGVGMVTFPGADGVLSNGKHLDESRWVHANSYLKALVVGCYYDLSAILLHTSRTVLS